MLKRRFQQYDDTRVLMLDGAGKLLTEQINLSATVSNLFDKMPPFDGSYPDTELQPYTIFNYNVNGRSYMMEMNYQFAKR